MRIRHYFASLAPPASDLPGEEDEAPRKKEVHDDHVDEHHHDDHVDDDGGIDDDNDSDAVQGEREPGDSWKDVTDFAKEAGEESWKEAQ